MSLIGGRLLEPTAIADAEDYGADEVRHLFIRRFNHRALPTISLDGTGMTD